MHHLFSKHSICLTSLLGWDFDIQQEPLFDFVLVPSDHQHKKFYFKYAVPFMFYFILNFKNTLAWKESVFTFVQVFLVEI